MAIPATQLAAGVDFETDFLQFAPGTLGDDGLIYFPETSATEDGLVLILDPSDGSCTLDTMGAGIGDWYLGHGHLLASDEIIYALNSSYNSAETRVYRLNPSTGVVTVPMITGTSVSSAGSSSCLHSNGFLYVFRGIAGGSRITKINTTSLAATKVDTSPLSGTQWYPAGATEGSDGKIYAPTGYYRWSVGAGDLQILIYDPATDTASFSGMGLSTSALTQKQFFADGIAMPDGKIYYMPGVYFDSDHASAPVLIIDPGAGTATLGTNAPCIAFHFGVTPWSKLVAGADGRIYYTGMSPADTTEPVLVAYDPATDTYETWTPTIPGPGGSPFYMLADGGNDVIWGAPGEAENGLYDVTNYVLEITPAPPAAGWSYALGSTPVTIALGSSPRELRIGSE